MKQRYSRDEALTVVRELLPLLTPYCVTVEGELLLKVAGSLRRMRADVGDIELVYVPSNGPVQKGLFTEDGNQFDAQLESLVLQRIIAPRVNRVGGVAWGKQNKLAVHVASGIPIDFFATVVPHFWNYLVCRTGGKINNIDLCQAADARGLMWHPYHGGFEVADMEKANAALNRTDLSTGRFVMAKTEREVFSIAGLPWREPKERL